MKGDYFSGLAKLDGENPAFICYIGYNSFAFAINERTKLKWK